MARLSSISKIRIDVFQFFLYDVEDLSYVYFYIFLHILFLFLYLPINFTLQILEIFTVLNS